MSNWNKEAVLKFLERNAPNAPLAECLSLVNDVESLKIQLRYTKEMMAILSQVLLENGNGAPLEKYKDVRPAIKAALSEVMNCNAWVVCGPVPDAMEKLMEEVENRKHK